VTLYLLATAEPKGDPLLLAFMILFFGWVIVLFLLQLFDR
jgi:hypothetical protein